MWTIQNLGYHYTFVFLSSVATLLLAIAIGLPDWVIRGPVIEDQEAVIYKDGLWQTCRYTQTFKSCHLSKELNQTASGQIIAWTGPVSALIVTSFVTSVLGVFDMLRRLWHAISPADLEMGLPVVLTVIATFCNFLSLEIHTNQVDDLCYKYWKRHCQFGSAYKIGWAAFVFGLWSFAPLLIRLAGRTSLAKRYGGAARSVAFSNKPTNPCSI